jgi:hypothetical protein
METIEFNQGSNGPSDRGALASAQDAETVAVIDHHANTSGAGPDSFETGAPAKGPKKGKR